MTLWGAVESARSAPAPQEPVPLTVEAPEPKPPTLVSKSLTDGLRGLYQKCQLYDIFLRCGEKRFPAHKVALAALSGKFCDELLAAGCSGDSGRDTPPGAAAAGGAAGGANSAGGSPKDPGGPADATPASELQAAQPPAQDPASRCPELDLKQITHPEAVSALIDFVYGLDEYRASSDEVNKDVLRIAQDFDLALLEEHASRHLVQGLTSENAIRRLATCEEFKLSHIAEEILDGLVASADALRGVAAAEDVLQHPQLLQRLLILAAERYGAGTPTPAPGSVKGSSGGESKRALGRAHSAPATGEERGGKRSKVSKDAAVTGGA